ncbi:hypothetical protein [Ferrimonas senticii]|uniref:hypothetical protein n=1 Tax=Ferrimonas senticii TaxID=394566 RepID=UPI00040ADDC5|nr:hypothetical protein [Ferrimonas senticii]
MNYQQGIALLTSVLLLLVLTVIAVALAERSRLSVQMTAASIAREQAQQQADSLQQALLSAQRQSPAGSLWLADNPVVPANHQLRLLVESGCRRRVNATAVGVVNCRHNELTTTVHYGRNQRGQWSVITGIEQPLLRR